MTPLVAVIIPTFNRASALVRCLQSLTIQTFSDFEVLICDDGSTDNTEQVVASFNGRLKIKYNRSENFGGPARPRNRGLLMAKSPYVAFLDSDDWWLPRKLEFSVQGLDSGADFVYHPLYVATRDRQRLLLRVTRTCRIRTPAFNDLLLRGNTICNSSVVTRRELLDRVGGFSEDRNLIAIEDYDAWLRVARLTDKFLPLRRVLGYYWSGGGNISSAHRTLQTTFALQERYKHDLERLNERALWIPYIRAQACLQLGQTHAAKQELKHASGSPFGPFPLRARIICLWALVRLRSLTEMIGRRSRVGRQC